MWSLACSKVEEWEQLIEQFKDATSKNEKELGNNLEALFEDIPQIIDAREAKLQKKLLAMAPRRTSGRISSKVLSNAKASFQTYDTSTLSHITLHL